MNLDKTLYKICPKKDWEIAEKNGVFTGSGIDLIDKFIHFSTSKQVKETAKLHFNGVKNLLLIKVNSENLNIKWEISRNGQLFPHLYNKLLLTDVLSVFNLELDDNNNHVFPSELDDR